jgi:hypothetical protein
MSHTTIHRRLQELAGSHDPFESMKDKGFRFLVVDGTKVHLQGAAGKDLGQVRDALGIGVGKGRFAALSRWGSGSTPSGARFERI